MAASEIASCSPFLLKKKEKKKGGRKKKKRKEKRLSHRDRAGSEVNDADMGGGTSLFQQDNVEHIIIPTEEKLSSQLCRRRISLLPSSTNPIFMAPAGGRL